jgi:hypothetical protein
MGFLWRAVSIRLDPLYRPDLLSITGSKRSIPRPPRVTKAASEQGGVIALNPAVCLPALFVLGLVSVVACIAFAEGCARI